MDEVNGDEFFELNELSANASVEHDEDVVGVMVMLLLLLWCVGRGVVV